MNTIIDLTACKDIPELHDSFGNRYSVQQKNTQKSNTKSRFFAFRKCSAYRHYVITKLLQSVVVCFRGYLFFDFPYL